MRGRSGQLISMSLRSISETGTTAFEEMPREVPIPDRKLQPLIFELSSGSPRIKSGAARPGQRPHATTCAEEKLAPGRVMAARTITGFPRQLQLSRSRRRELRALHLRLSRTQTDGLSLRGVRPSRRRRGLRRAPRPLTTGADPTTILTVDRGRGASPLRHENDRQR